MADTRSSAGNSAGDLAGNVPVWKFGAAVLDEAARELRVAGEIQELDAKSLDVLLLLLRHAGEVVTKEEIFASVWTGRITVEGVLSNAVSRLRKALRDDGQTLIVTQHRIGYRYAGTVARSWISRGPLDTRLKPGDPVPTRNAWRLVRALGPKPGEVWLAEHDKTREPRVFKFAHDGQALNALKREVTIARVARAVLGERRDLAQILEWNFESAPFFIECAYGGDNLVVWAEQRGGLATLDLDARLALFRLIAEAVAAVHLAGILHKDLKPSNVLVWEDEAGQPGIRLADFGLGTVLHDPEQIAAFGVTRQGLTLADDDPALTSGTPLYLAPELLAGQMPTTQSDLYALGILLFQLCVGSFQARPSPGWEAEIADPLLREDIALAASGDPARRLHSVDELLGRLRNLEARRREQADYATLRQRAQEAEQALQHSRARRPALIAAFASIAIGLAVVSWLLLREARALDDARRQRGIAQATVDFFSQDLVGQANPKNHGAVAMTVAEAVDRAATRIDGRLGRRPEIAAPLHTAIGDLYGAQGRYEEAQRHFDSARRLYAGSDAGQADEAARLAIESALSLARGGQIEAARKALAALAEAPDRHLDRTLYDSRLHCAESDLAMLAQDIQAAEGTARQCLSGLERQAPGSSPRLATELAQRRVTHVYTMLRLGDAAGAERDSRLLLAQLRADPEFGPAHPLSLALQTTLGDSLLMLERVPEALAVLEPLPARLAEQYGRRHMNYARAAMILADALSAAERFDEAIALYLELIDTFDTGFDGRHPYAIVAIQSLASVYDNAGRDRDSIAALERGLRIVERNYGPDSPVENRLHYDIADSLLKLADTAAALPHLAVLEQPRLEAITPYGNWTGRLELMRGRADLQRKRFADAEQHFDTAVTALAGKRDGHLRERAEAFLARARQHDAGSEAPVWALSFAD